MRDYSLQEINQAIELMDSIRGFAKDHLEYGFDDDWPIFVGKMRILTSQAWGSRIQNHIFRALGWERIPSSLGRGDVKNSLGQYFEVKVTIISSSNTCANIVQIRLWQSINGHHIFVIDATKNCEVTHFFLSTYDMKQEVELCGSSAHGTKVANTSNKNIEWAIRISWKSDNKTYQRWIAKYKQESNIGKE